MKTVTNISIVSEEKCTGCGACVKVCPVDAIHIEKTEIGKKAVVDGDICQGCNICVSRCQFDAMTLEQLKEENYRDVWMGEVEVTPEIKKICTNAHMYPDQIVCFCHRVKAKEIAAAILEGAHTPEDISRKTGARAGCGVLCMTSILRLLKGAEIELKSAPGNQWYNKIMTIWDLPQNVIDKYGEQYYLESDREFQSKVYPGGDK